MTFIEPLNLEEIFLVTLAGSVEIFIFLSFLAIAWACSYYKIPGPGFLLLVVVYGLVMSQYIGGVYLLIILIGGIITFWSLSKIFTK